METKTPIKLTKLTPITKIVLQYSRSLVLSREGGGPKSGKNSTTPGSTNPIYPDLALDKGPLRLALFQSITTNQQTWIPEYPLLYSASHHPLLSSVTSQHLDEIRNYCQLPHHAVIAYSAYRPTMAVQTYALRNLVSHRKLVNDEVINLFLEVLCHDHNLSFLSPTFFNILQRDGGQRSLRHFASASRHRHRTIYRPTLQGEAAIAIPCHIGNCHWVGVVRREISGQVYFLYSDDLNDQSTETEVKETLMSMGIEFFPCSARWVNCEAYTYLPHSNECGARTLLALTIMMLHPIPNSTILLPYMNENIANIARVWVASILISGQLYLPHMQTEDIIQTTNTNTRTSQPSSIIAWSHRPSSRETDGISQPISLLESHALTSSPMTKITRLSPNNKHSKTPRPPKDMAFHDRFQPKITTYFKGTSKTTSKAITDIPLPKPKRKLPKKLPFRKPKQPLNLPPPLPSLYDFPIIPPSSTPPQNNSPPWGHALESIDPTRIIRILLQNPNGVKPIPSDMDFQYSLSACHEIGGGILSLPETNTSWHHFSQISNTQNIFRKVWTTSAFQVSHGRENFHSSYKPGGTLTAVTGRWTSRVVDKGEDPFGLGRWSFITLRGKQDKRITFITGYRVCNSSISSVGEKTALKQQYRHLSAKWREYNWQSSPDPHRQFILDLQAWIEVLISENHAIILSLDNNEDLLTSTGQFMPLHSDLTKHATNHHQE
jgi:hypothetical protein